MKASKRLLLLLLAFTAFNAFAQTAKTNAAALVGTWQEKTDSAQEIKIISPTHVFFFVKNEPADSFAHAGAGTYSLSGNQYTEHLKYGDFDVNGVKSSYNYSVDGNQLKQQGTLVLADGSQYPIDHTFTRVEDAPKNSGRQIGTWNQLSSSFLGENGAKTSHTNATHIRYQIITPTHWMRISLANGKFENAFGGTYTMNGDKAVIKIDFASDPSLLGATAELTQKFQDNKMTVSGPVKDAQGKQVNEITDVFERVDKE